LRFSQIFNQKLTDYRFDSRLKITITVLPWFYTMQRCDWLITCRRLPNVIENMADMTKDLVKNNVKTRLSNKERIVELVMK
jgi:hypothetical protein